MALRAAALTRARARNNSTGNAAAARMAASQQQQGAVAAAVAAPADMPSAGPRRSKRAKTERSSLSLEPVADDDSENDGVDWMKGVRASGRDASGQRCSLHHRGEQ